MRNYNLALGSHTSPAPQHVHRTIFNMPDGDYLMYTHTGFELVNRDARTRPHGNASSVRLLRRFNIDVCKQMSVNLGDKKIRFTHY